MLRAIEQATRQPIEAMGLPSVADVNEQRVARFKSAVGAALETEELGIYREVALACQAETGADMVDIAAALARLLRGGDDLLLSEQAASPVPHERPGRAPRPERREGGRSEASHDDSDKISYRIEVGRVHGVKPGNIVGAIANEGGLGSSAIGRVSIQHNFSLVDLPARLAPGVLEHLGQVRVVGQALRIQPDSGPGRRPERAERTGGHDRPRRPERDARPEPDGRRSRPAGERPAGPRPSHRKAERTGPGGKAPRADKPAPDAVRRGDETPKRKSPVVTRAQRKAGHGSRNKSRK
jgi:ATP-dependent RNA helicase DeaD